MRCSGFRSFLAVGVLLIAILVGSTSSGRCADRGVAPQAPDNREAFVRRVFKITDLVLERHIDPPTRQEMILGGIKAALAAAKKAPSPDLSRRVSDVRTPGELVRLLNELWPESKEKPAPAAKAAAAEFESAFVGGLLHAVPGQPYFVSAKAARAESQLQANRYVGLGIAVGWEDKSRLTQINNVIPGGPAEQAGIRQGDLIEEIDHLAVTPGTRLKDVIERIRGAEGTKVTLGLRNPDSKGSRTLTVVRLPVMIKSVEDASDNKPIVHGNPPLRIGHLKIDSVTASTAQELRSWETKLESAGVQAVILDLRRTGSPGVAGDHSAVLLADSLLDGGTLGRFRTREGVREFKADRDCLFRGWPLVILIDEYTWGAAEWVAAALQDADPPDRRLGRRAVIVGRASRGFNFVSSAVPFPGSDEYLILATGIWQRPNTERPAGEYVRNDDPTSQGWRVVPDLVVGDAEASENSVIDNIQGVVLYNQEPVRPAKIIKPPLKKVPTQKPAQKPAHNVETQTAKPAEDGSVRAAVAEIERQWKAASHTTN
ncbi:MAG TPA: S41 family peptidase [Planctomycetaceae bacterium]|jgi:carboxyl-terminal processing protease|nr:S41 family peptidase [Planctomycetaceae bacterium]